MDTNEEASQYMWQSFPGDRSKCTVNNGWRIILWLEDSEVNEKRDKQKGITLSHVPEYANDRAHVIITAYHTYK